MKKVYLTLIWLFILSARSGAQHTKHAERLLAKSVTLSFREVTLEQLLQHISREYEVAFSYSSNIVPVEERVSITVSGQSLESVLNRLLGKYNLVYTVRGNRIILRQPVAPLQQIVKGTVIDRASKAPVAGANISMLNYPQLNAVTDAGGHFRLSGVPIGRQTLQVSHIGYETCLTRDLLVGSGKEVVLVLEVSEAVSQIDEVVVSAEVNKSESVSEMSMVSTRALPIEETKRYASSLNDPARVVAAYPGVSGDDYLENNLVIRGNSSRGLLWRLEGVEIPNPNHFADEGNSGGGVSIVSTSVLANSEFLTGAFPARYGNALSGVLDLRLRTGNQEKREYTVQAGTMGLDVALEGPFRKGKPATFLFNYRYSRFSLLNRLGFNISQPNRDAHYQDIAFKISIPTRNAGTFAVFGIGGMSGYRLDSTNIEGQNQSDMGVLGVSHQLQLNRSTAIQSTLSLSGTRIGQQRTFRVSSNSLVNYRESFAKAFTRASVVVHKKWSARHLMETGIVYSFLSYQFRENRDFPSGMPATNLAVFDEQGNTGLLQGYVSWRYRVAERLALVGGLHALHFRLNQRTSAEPRFGFTWRLTTRHTLHGGAGIHSRIEPLQYYFARFVLPDGTRFQYNRNLDFTRARHFVLGYSFQPLPRLLLHLETYYQNIFKVPVRSDSAAIFSTISVYEGFVANELVNQGVGDNYGIELSVEKSLDKRYYMLWNGALYRATYRTLDNIRRNTPYNGAFNTHLLAGKEFRWGRQGSKRQFNLNLKATCNGGKRYIPVDLPASVAAGREVLRMSAAYQNQLDTYTRVDMQLIYRNNRPRFTGEWRVDVLNVTNNQSTLKYYYNPGTEQVERLAQLGILPVVAYRMEF